MGRERNGELLEGKPGWDERTGDVATLLVARARAGRDAAGAALLEGPHIGSFDEDRVTEFMRPVAV